MRSIFETVLYTSISGSFVVVLLLFLKPVSKKLPAKWQYAAWLFAALCMVMPFWKFMPEKAEPDIPTATYDQASAEGYIHESIPENAPVIYPKADSGKMHFRPGITEFVWLGGMCIFLISAFLSYIIFLFKKRSSSFDMHDYSALEAALKELKIKRKIRLRITCDNSPPILVGVFFPVIYLPQKAMGEEAEKMVLCHELTHFKRNDLFVKWLILLINAIHWFNPFMYILAQNISSICEVSCDMSVISGMDMTQKNIYMNAILDIAEGRLQCSDIYTQPR